MTQQITKIENMWTKTGKRQSIQLSFIEDVIQFLSTNNFQESKPLQQANVRLHSVTIRHANSSKLDRARIPVAY